MSTIFEAQLLSRLNTRKKHCPTKDEHFKTLKKVIFGIFLNANPELTALGEEGVIQLIEEEIDNPTGS